MRANFPIMKLIFGDEFIFYTSSMYEIYLHCHWLGFSYFILNLGQCEGYPAIFKGGPVEERLYKKTSQYSKFEFSLPKTES